ncbi:MAG TPA: replication-associated recombination protein A [Steroidobacteraceae bacterium]|nr:replication-associated recombination protein A [Steroidobacteraceae bacterium]
MRQQAELPISAAPAGAYRPLADRMRPRTLAEFAGQQQLLAPGKPLHRLLTDGIAHSMVLWGPPGSGKTTLARLAAQSCQARFISLSAVVAGVKDIRQAVEEARASRAQGGPATVLFLDEVHRFNKAQQDTFLPFVEDGTLVFIGATTENPSFELNSALLSRARVYVLRSLASTDLITLIQRALADAERGLGSGGISAMPEALALLADAADGDARRALNLLEVAADLAVAAGGGAITLAAAQEACAGGHRRFDKRGELFYDQISALHKSVRDSDPDASLYWLCRMLDGGCDPGFIARRMARMASEDIGNADPRALTLALAAWDSYDRLGSPEGELALAQACVFLACAPKSNAVYRAFGEAMDDARNLGTLDVPLHLRNAPTRLMKDLGYGSGYRYAHDEPGALAPGQRHFPDAMEPRNYYDPVPRGLELKMREMLARIRAKPGQPAAPARQEDDRA